MLFIDFYYAQLKIFIIKLVFWQVYITKVTPMLRIEASIFLTLCTKQAIKANHIAEFLRLKFELGVTMKYYLWSLIVAMFTIAIVFTNWSYLTYISLCLM